MSITTKQGDQGRTALMYNRKVAKDHPQVDAYGTVDELSCALGLIRCILKGEDDAEVHQSIFQTQQYLVILMGELATIPADLQRYSDDGFEQINDFHVNFLNDWVSVLENKKFTGWATPGENELSARIEMARSICRRAERAVCKYYNSIDCPADSAKLSHPAINPNLLAFLNRLSDILWLLAREME